MSRSRCASGDRAAQNLSQVSQNAEIQALLQILNLDPAQAAVSRSKLRYGHVMLMTDQVAAAPEPEDRRRRSRTLTRAAATVSALPDGRPRPLERMPMAPTSRGW